MRTITQANSRIQGAWPGRLGQTGKLPNVWSAKTRGLILDIVDKDHSVDGIDYVEIHLWGHASQAGFAQIFLAPRTPVDLGGGSIGDVDMGVYLAIVGGTRTNIPKAHLGIELRNDNGNVIASPTVEIADWQKLGSRLRSVTTTLNLAGEIFAEATPFLGLEVATGEVLSGPPINITLRMGWTFTVPVDPPLAGQRAPLAFTAM